MHGKQFVGCTDSERAVAGDDDDGLAPWPLQTEYFVIVPKTHGIVSSGLTLSLPIPLSLYTLPYWSNPPFLIFDIRALWRSGLSARAPECQKLKMVGYTSMALKPSNSSNLEQLALKGLSNYCRHYVAVVADI